MRTKEFDRFFERSSRIVERALDSDYNLMKDYFVDDELGEQASVQKGDKIHHQFTFMESEF